jgi:malate dehydrogenase (oxaloacetate-decarboxylating)(NADP+)
MDRPVQVLQLGSQVRAIVNMALIAVVDAQMKSPKLSDTKMPTRPKKEKSKNRKETALS